MAVYESAVREVDGGGIVTRFTQAQREQIRCTGAIARETGERDCVSIHCEHGVRPAWQGLTDRQARIMLRYVWLCAGAESQ